MANDDLWPGENLLGTWISGTTLGKANLSRTGGTLILTDQRLIFKPMVFNLPTTIGMVTDSVVSLDAHYLALLDIDTVEAVPDRPRLRVDLTSGAERFYFVLVSRFTTVFSRRSLPARDDAVRRISAAVSDARSRR